MPKNTVTPTRMVLNQLKGRLRTATRGHKLLKDKRDEEMRQFMDIVRENQRLRTKVEAGLTGAFAAMSMAGATLSPETLEQSLLCVRRKVNLQVSEKNIMSVKVPVYTFDDSNPENGTMFPYGFAETSSALDEALAKMNEVFQDMLDLAEIEKTAQLLAQDIEKTRRRVNALEYVMIPELQENIRYISMKLAENESSTKVRLLKVKDMVLQNAHHYEE